MPEQLQNCDRLTPLRFAAALLLGLLGGLFIWVATPYVDIVINCNAHAADLSDGYLPKGAMFVLLLSVLVLNPLLLRLRAAARAGQQDRHY